MLDQTKAKIFLAGERGHTETEWFRSYNTFNFGGYQSEYKQPFGDLYVWNDDTLAGGRSFQLLIEQDSLVFLLPVVGSIEYKDSSGNESLLQAGQAFSCFVEKGTTVRLINPYKEELVNFLQAWFKQPESLMLPCALKNFSLEEEKDRLVSILDKASGVHCSIGKFDGRSEGVYHPVTAESRVFVFVIQGAFEVQNRLLETRDGLALWDINEIAFEALSNEAILLLVEMPATP